MMSAETWPADGGIKPWGDNSTSEYCSNDGLHTTKASSAQMTWIREDLGFLMECDVTRLEDKSN